MGPHGGDRWMKTRAMVIAAYTHCHLCGQPVDKTLRWPHPMSPSMDHVVPIAEGGAVYDLANLRLAHFRCNLRKGRRLDQPRRSREW